MNKRGLHISIILFLVSCISFSLLLLSMGYMVIQEEYQIQGELKKEDGDLIFVFRELDTLFSEYEPNDFIKIRTHSTNDKITGVIEEKRRVEGIQLKEGDVYVYKVRITDGNKNIDDKEKNFYIQSKKKTTMIDLLLYEKFK